MCAESAPDKHDICRAYFDGLVAMHWVDVGLNDSRPIFCAPVDTTLRTLRITFAAWAARHPSHLHRSALLGALAALREAFPCPTDDP